MLPGLPEPDAWVDDQVLGRDTGGLRGPGAFQQEGAHLLDHVLVARVLLHGRGRALHVHEDERYPAGRRHPEHARVVASGGDVVDERCTGSESRLRDVGPGGVDADRDVRGQAGAQALDDAEDAPRLFRRRHRQGPGARRFAADIDDIGALLDHAERVIDRGPWFREPPAVGEAIGGEVQDPDDTRRRSRLEGRKRPRQ